MPDPIDPLEGPKFVLEGRLVTMGNAGVIDDGAIYIEKGGILAVQPAGDAAPAGFEDVPRIRTGDTIYPGMIELHNHLSYNAMPLWDVPQKFSHNGSWKNHDDYRRYITKPAQVLGRTGGVVEAVVRFVECRSLLGGTTTSQGITLYKAGDMRAVYKGLVRNVEQTDEPALPRAGTKIANPDKGKADKYLETLNKNTCYLQHLSEGIGDTPRSWFLRLRLDSGDWAVNDRFCGIHSTALTADDFKIIKDRGGSMVWSPLSNYLLYGETLDLRAAKDSGITMGLGCDWAPSGSKNLLGELKVAWLASEEEGGVFSFEDFAKMVTINPARILKWDGLLGSIEAGKRADLIAINGQQGDPYEQLVKARETALTFVAINGVPRLGQRRLMDPFGAGTETIDVGSSERVLNLKQDTAHPLIQGLKLTDAIATLQDAMERLPELAEALDSNTGGGVFHGSADQDNVRWALVTEFDDDEPELAGADLPYADWVVPMALEPITVADDSHFLRNLVAARNLPEFVKEGLPPLFGESIPIPDSAGFTRDIPTLPATRDLRTFLRTSGELSNADRLRIVGQALVLLDQNYVHLPLKRAMHAVDPLQRLRLLRARLEQGEPAGEIEFHNELARILNSVRDLHTIYRLPRPWRGKTAWLPFLIEEYWDHGHRRYMVTKVVGSAGPDSFQPGVEVLNWNGLPIHVAVTQNAEREAGSNEAARLARGLNSLTLRPLARGLPPEEEWVEIRYRTADGGTDVYRQEWLMFGPGRSPHSVDPEARHATALGLDAQTDDIQEAKRVLFAGDIAAQERAGRRRLKSSGNSLATELPTVFRATRVETSHGPFGCIRIFTFNVNDPQVFLDEFVRLAAELPQRGLIIDVRGNGGGHIHAAERLLQVLTPRRIDPERAQFINSRLNLELCRAYADPDEDGFTLAPWVDSIQESVRTGATFSLGFPITPPELCNDLGQRYHGPVVLITDALCYSATDMFAAGFRDHGIGPILGIHENTGAGGANVWSHALLRQLFPAASSPYEPLPGGADLRVAIRRTLRVGENVGGIVEDLGIRPDVVYRMKEEDVKHGNRGLLERAGAMLAKRPPYRLAIEAPEWPRAAIATRHISHLEVAVNRRTLVTYPVEHDRVTLDLGELGARPPLTLDLRGFDDEDNLVAAYHRQIPGN